MKVSILLLCHESAHVIAKKLNTTFFQNSNIKVYIHYDGIRKNKHVDQLRELIPQGVNYQILDERVKCDWGEYSLVEATRRLMSAALHDTEFEGDYFSLLSGSCIPIKPASSLLGFLELRNGTDFIESVDISQRRWVLDGLQEERYRYFFPFNFKTQKFWFEVSTSIQRKLNISRAIPKGLKIHFGSQWFTITRHSAKQVCELLEDPSIRKFFEHSWIPDEFAIQTLIRVFQSSSNISSHGLTYYEFDPHGRPLVLDNGHVEHLKKQPFFFARKISPTADSLLKEIDAHHQSNEEDTEYFSHVGIPSVDYRCFVARAKSVATARSKVATIADPWRGLMDNNERAYYVIWSSSRSYIQAIISNLKERHAGPVYGYLFDSFRLDIAGHEPDRFGLSASVLARRNIAPDSLLHEVANAHPIAPCIFAVDPTDANWLRDFVYWDPNATLICCEPSIMTKMQRAEAFLRHPQRHWQSDLVTSTYQAAFNNSWLPVEHFLKAFSTDRPKCKVINMYELTDSPEIDAVHGIKLAAERVDASSHFSSDHLAWVGLKRAQPGRNS